MARHIAYIGLGSNLGDRYSNLARAVDRIRQLPSTLVEGQSGNYLTAPMGPRDQPDFLNSVIGISTEMSPGGLLDALKEIEKSLGREETYRWGPRLIDIDILLYDEIVIDEEDLKIPHPRMHEREFALEPLCEIAPDALHPAMGKTVEQILRELRNK
ncbi:MAG: 2-amino-4-hydroxy-6-hydroxymethyldihydropteridine diphosphokinase [Planctomycetota bacterium]|nr:MAG: 2-amino-4-hydroxy-6-hydroxymethyldihydropteridine diphosphokinase [Planctomycetota bacterium]